jgi:hypothetical protein
VITSQREQYGVTVHLFIGTGHSLGKISFMSLKFTVSQKASCRGLSSLFPFRSISSSTTVPCAKLKHLQPQLRSWFILLLDRAFHTMHTFISKPKLPVTVYYTRKHVSCVFEDLQKRKAPNTIYN